MVTAPMTYFTVAATHFFHLTQMVPGLRNLGPLTALRQSWSTVGEMTILVNHSSSVILNSKRLGIWRQNRVLG